jgi:hypothetical protein
MFTHNLNKDSKIGLCSRPAETPVCNYWLTLFCVDGKENFRPDNTVFSLVLIFSALPLYIIEGEAELQARV